MVHDDANESYSIETDHSGLNKCGGPTDTLYTKLANAIRRLKAPSLLELADTWIRVKHYTADRLKIERLSGEPLSMNQCYINLVIVEKSVWGAVRSAKTSPSPFSILTRQKVEAADKAMQVDLSAIFNERKGSNDRLIHPRRILIRGRAGVGKTTLCKKIVYEFTNKTWSKWNELFDRVLWVPLRNLKLSERRKKAKYTFEHLFSHEFLLPTNGQSLARALSRELDSKTNKTLFILDGLDEVSQDLIGDGSMPRFLAELLRQPNVVITARPSAKPPPNLDLELETIGFGPDQVNDYIENTFTDLETGGINRAKIDKVQSFLKERWLIQGLVRIPIQLDAFCYTWDELNPDAIPDTMTGMYNNIVQKLWNKDIERLAKKYNGKVLRKESLQTAGRQKVERIVKDELIFLESLAFTGLYNDIVDFASGHLDSISDHFTPSLLPNTFLPMLSFLRASDVSSNYFNQNYHFIHLSFQEYFAAQYFVRQWKHPKGQLQFLRLGIGSRDTDAKVSTPAEFIQKAKYTARYDIFWRFVAGLLDESGLALGFISIIEEEPLDLLGPTHQRLIMHCLSEISNNLPTREGLEKRLARWLLFESKFNGTAHLASEVEFPEAAMKIALGSSDIQNSLLRSLAIRTSLSPSIIEGVVARVDDEDVSIRRLAIEALGGQVVLRDEVLKVVVARLDDKEWKVRTAAILALGGRAVLSDRILLAVAARLDDEYREVQSTAVRALDGRALPDEVLTFIVARLDDADLTIRRSALKILRGRAVVPNETQLGIMAQLNDKNRQIRRAAVEALGRREAVPDDMVRMVLLRLEDEHWDVRGAAVYALGRQKALSGEMLKAIATRLDDEDALVREIAITAIGKQELVPDKMLMAIVARLGDKDSNVRQAAANAIDRLTVVPDKMVMSLVPRLDDKEPVVRRTAVRIVGRQTAVPDNTLMSIVARLEDKDSSVQNAALGSLTRQTKLPDEVFRAVVARLDNEDHDTRWAAANVLIMRKVVPVAVLEAIRALFDNTDSHVREVAIYALGWERSVPDDMLRAVAARIYDMDWNVRWAAVEVLGWQTAIPDDVLNVVAAQLDDESGMVRQAAVKTLCSHASLPDGMLRVVAARLNDEREHVRSAAATLLLRKANINRIHYSQPTIASLYKVLLERSFEEQICWWIDQGNSRIDVPEGIRQFPTDQHQNSIRDWVNEARPTDCPPTSSRGKCGRRP